MTPLVVALLSVSLITAFLVGLFAGLSHNPTCLKPHVGEEYKRFIEYVMKTLSDRTRLNGKLASDITCILLNAKELKERIEKR